MADFTPTQGRYLAYIHSYTEGFGLPPAESEIAAAIGVSPPSVNQMMKTHLHQFEIADTRYTDPRFMMDDFDDFGAIDYSGMRVSDLVSEHGAKLRMGYEYDFGDGWQHEVVLEKVTESEPGIRYPRCIDGERACPLR
jgi:hypothetical protein